MSNPNVSESGVRGGAVRDQDQLERALCEIWEKLLSVDVTPVDDFFELGGYSLLVVNVVAEARQAGITMAPDDVFDYKTPRAIAAALLSDAGADGDERPVPDRSGHDLASFWLTGRGRQGPGK